MSVLRLPADLVEDARRLRRDATDAENFLWKMVRNRRFGGFKFRRQFAVPPYVLDFYCAELRLGIELDGGQHAEPERVDADRRRSEFLERHGIRGVRFWNNEVLGEDVGSFVARLWNLLHRSPGSAASDEPA